MDVFQFIPGYETAIYRAGREPAFVVLLSFVITYMLTRGYTRLARRTGWGGTNIAGVHTHHMVFGLVLAFLSASLMFGFLPQQGILMLLLAVGFGSGAAMVLDEFALLFHLRDVYWEKEGRKSIDAVVLGLSFGSLFLMRITPFGLKLDDPSWTVVTTIVINLGFAIVAALKGKTYTTVFGIFVPSIAQIGAIRLARPDSAWAHTFYKHRPKKMERSKKRFAMYARRVDARKEKLWDLIGGKTGRPHHYHLTKKLK